MFDLGRSFVAAVETCALVADRRELLFEIFSQRYKRGPTLLTSNLPFDEWTGVFGSRAEPRAAPRA